MTQELIESDDQASQHNFCDVKKHLDTLSEESIDASLDEIDTDGVAISD